MNTNNNIRLETYINNLNIIISLNDKLLQSIFQKNLINNKIIHLEEQLINSKNLTEIYEKFLNNFLKNHPSIKPSNNNNNIENNTIRLVKDNLDVFMKKLSYLIFQINHMSKINDFLKNIKNIQNTTKEIIVIKKNLKNLKKIKKILENIYS